MSWKLEALSTLRILQPLLEADPVVWYALRQQDDASTELITNPNHLVPQILPGQPVPFMDTRLVEAQMELERLQAAVEQEDKGKALAAMGAARRLLG